MPRQKPAMPYKSTSVRLPAPMWDRIGALAEKGKRSLSAQIEVMAEEWLAANDEVMSAAPPKAREKRA